MSDVRSFVPAIARSALVGVLLTLVGCDAVQESFGLDRGTASEVVSTSTLPVFDPANPVSAFPANTLDPSGDVARYSLGSVYILGGQTVTPQEDLSYVREGIATIGSEMFTGTTASQERYNPGLLTAAHRTLPFSTIVKVTNLDNDRATLMRINDRGPNDFTHLIEVTPAAARVLGIGANSVSMVSVEVVEAVTRNVAQATGGQLGRALPTPTGPVIANPAAVTAQPAVTATITPAAPVDTAPLDDPFAGAVSQNALTAPAVPVFNAAPADGTGTPGSTFRPAPLVSAPTRFPCSSSSPAPVRWSSCPPSSTDGSCGGSGSAPMPATPTLVWRWVGSSPPGLQTPRWSSTDR